MDDLAGCVGKAKFESYHAASRVQKRRANNREFRKHAIYRCSSCRSYHIGGGGDHRERQIKELRRFVAQYE